MSVSLKGRSLLTLKDYSFEEIRLILDTAHRLKKEVRSTGSSRIFTGKNLALLFEKRSTRTRCAFETAFAEEGGHPVFLSTQDIHLGEKESIEDTARVFGRMFDAIQFRGYRQRTAEILAQYSCIPVYNGLTDLFHPTQALADLMTIEEVFSELENRKLVYLGDGRNNTVNSLLVACVKMGLDITVIAPESLIPDQELLDFCAGVARTSRATITITQDIAEGIRGADIVYTDVWISMGEEEREQERLALLRPYQVDTAKMKMTGKPETIFLHDLPAVKGNEVTAEVFEGEQSRVWDQAENRKHSIKAILTLTL